MRNTIGAVASATTVQARAPYVVKTEQTITEERLIDAPDPDHAGAHAWFGRGRILTLHKGPRVPVRIEQMTYAEAIARRTRVAISDWTAIVLFLAFTMCLGIVTGLLIHDSIMETETAQQVVAFFVNF